MEWTRYLAVDMAAEGTMEARLSHSVSERAEVQDALSMSDGTVVPKVLYGCEDLLEMKFLRTLYVLWSIGRIRNERGRERRVSSMSRVDRAANGVVKLFIYMKRRSKEKLTREVYVTIVGDKEKRETEMEIGGWSERCIE